MKKGDGIIRHFVGDARISWIDTRDVVAVAAFVLQHPAKHAGKIYHLGYDQKTCEEIVGADAIYDNFFALTGREPTSWAQFARDNAAAFSY